MALPEAIESQTKRLTFNTSTSHSLLSQFAIPTFVFYAGLTLLQRSSIEDFETIVSFGSVV